MLPALRVVLPPKVLAAVRFNTPAAPLVNVVVAPLIKPTVPEVMGFKVTAWVASMLSTVISSALTLTVVRAVAPPPTALAKLTSLVPAEMVTALAALVAVSVPVMLTLALATKVLSNKKLLPAADNTTLPPNVCAPAEVTWLPPSVAKPVTLIAPKLVIEPPVVRGPFTLRLYWLAEPASVDAVVTCVPVRAACAPNVTKPL